MFLKKEINSLKKINFIDKCYYIFLSLMIFLNFLPINDNIIKIFFGLLACFFWSVKFINTKYTKKEYIILFILMFLAGINVLTAHREGLFFSILALAGSKNIDLKKILKIILILGGVCFTTSVIVYLCKNGFQTDAISTRYVFGFSLNVNKNSLGYIHANYTYTLVVVLSACYLYVNYDSLNIKDYILMLIVGIIFFILTFSRTGFIVFMFMLLLCFVLKKDVFTQKISSLMKGFPSFVVLVSFIFPLIHKIYPIGIIEKVNSTLQGRLFLSHEFWEFFTPTLFGRNVDDITGYSGYYLKCDNSFIIILCAYGIIAFGVFLYVTIKLNKLNINKKDLMLLDIFYLYGFAEAFFVIAFLNISFFVFKYMVFANNQSDDSVSLLTLFKERIQKNG